MKGLQHWTAYPPPHAAPATPEDHPDHFRSPCLDASAFPFCPQSRHLHFSLTRLHLGSLALRPAALPSGNLRPLITQTPLPCATGVHGQFPGRDSNPLDKQLLLRTDIALYSYAQKNNTKEGTSYTVFPLDISCLLHNYCTVNPPTP